MIALIIITLYIACAIHWGGGGGSVHWGYHECIAGCSVHWEDIVSAFGGVRSGMYSALGEGDILSALGECTVHWEDTMSALGDHDLFGEYYQCIGGVPQQHVPPCPENPNTLMISSVY